MEKKKKRPVSLLDSGRDCESINPQEGRRCQSLAYFSYNFLIRITLLQRS